MRYNEGMSNLKGIPVVKEDSGPPRSGEKYLTPQGFTAIRDGIKRAAAGSAVRAPKPPWLKARAPTGTGYAQVKSLVREHRLATVCEIGRAHV